MMLFTGQIAKTGHFLQPTSKAMGHRVMTVLLGVLPRSNREFMLPYGPTLCYGVYPYGGVRRCTNARQTRVSKA